MGQLETVDLVVSRHQGLIEVLLELGVVTPATPVLQHAGPDDIRGKHVAGVIPPNLEEECAFITKALLKLPPELRGKELDAKQTLEHLVSIATFQPARRIRTLFRKEENENLG